MSDYLPVDAYGRLARMARLKGFPQSGGYMYDVRGTIDRDRLAEALETVIRVRHPVAGCRMARYLGIFYRWKRAPFHPDDYIFGPFQELREFDVFRDPPIRIHLGEGQITFEMNHTAFDGVGLLRLVRSIMEQYAALPEELPPLLDEVELRRTGAYWGERPRKHGRNPGRRFLDPEKGTVLANRADFVHRTGEPGALGTLLKHITLPLPRVKEHARSLGCTVNDLFVGAVLTQIARWNAENGTTARYLSVDVPANLRPPDRPMELAANVSGNFTINVVNLQQQDTPRLIDLVRKVSAQFRQAKAEGWQWTGIGKRSTLRYPTELVVMLGRWLLDRIHNRILRFGPTAIISNFGRVPGIDADFGGVRLENMRVLGTAFSPLTLNTCSPNSEKCILSFCVRKSHFSPETIERFVSETGRLIVEGDGHCEPKP
jgi:hypothetical protein